VGAKENSLLSEHIRIYDLHGTLENPPNAKRIPSKNVHLHKYDIDIAYVATPDIPEIRNIFKKRVYDIISYLDNVRHNPPAIRIAQKHPATPWERVWRNLHGAEVPDAVKSTCFATIHDIIPTNDRLAAIHLSDTSSCSRCGNPDSIQHKITDCAECKLLWNWTREKLGIILHLAHRHIPLDWTTHPVFQYRPKQRQVATLWILAQFVHYQLQTHRRLSLEDYMDCLKRERWKVSHTVNKRPDTGHYLDVLQSYNQQWKTSSLLTCLEKSLIPYRK